MTAAASKRAKSIGHYILGKTIGEGTFGKVKLGTHILTGEKVAVKILEKERIVDSADVERVAREIHILKLIQHPHVIQLYEIIETPRQLYLITEYCSGGELFDHIVASGRVKEKEACRFFHQILGGVEQIHKMSVVHRDLKPENLLLDDHKNIKIVDFGLSNTFQEGQLLKTACGSPCYAAPEMIAGQRYVPSRCDVWSCGVILFALVCGYLPFEDQNTANLYRKILNADYEPPKFISDNVRDLISKMLTTDPDQRYTISRIRAHPWYRQIPEASHSWDGDKGSARPLEEDMLEQLDRFGFPREYAVKCLQMNKHNHVTTTYYLLLEKKRRMADRGQGLTMSADFSGGGTPRTATKGEVQPDVLAECEGLDENTGPGELGGEGVTAHKVASEPLQNAAADADRAGGALPMPLSTRQPRTPEPHNPTALQWAHSTSPSPQSQQLPPTPPQQPHQQHHAVAQANAQAREKVEGHRTDPPQIASARSDGTRRHVGESTAARRTSVSAEPAGIGQPHSARVPNTARRHSDNYAGTPRGGAAVPGSGGTGSAGLVPTPRKRSPIQQATGLATPRGPVMTPPMSATPSRPAVENSPRGHEAARIAAGTPTTHRSSTPGKRLALGTTSSGASSARGAGSGSRPSTSQGMAGPSRPSGSATARGVNEARRRQYMSAASADNAAGGAGEPPMSARGGGSTGSRASANGPTPAWASARPPVAGSSHQGGAARASSVSPEGAFNVSCTSSKAPKQIMQEIHRALTIQRVAYKQSSAFLVRCQRQGLRFEMEISHLDHLESIYVVRFRRVAGDLVGYKDLCSKVLAEMKI